MIQRLGDRRSLRLSPAGLAVTVVGAAAIVLRRFPPESYHFYPGCPIASYLHLQCPGCGTTRALAALLRGDPIEALHLNPLTSVLIPVAVFYIARHLWGQRYKELITLPHPPQFAVFLLLSVAAIFTVARNLTL